LNVPLRFCSFSFETFPHLPPLPPLLSNSHQGSTLSGHALRCRSRQASDAHLMLSFLRARVYLYQKESSFCAESTQLFVPYDLGIFRGRVFGIILLFHEPFAVVPPFRSQVFSFSMLVFCENLFLIESSRFSAWSPPRGLCRFLPVLERLGCCYCDKPSAVSCDSSPLWRTFSSFDASRWLTCLRSPPFSAALGFRIFLHDKSFLTTLRFRTSVPFFVWVVCGSRFPLEGNSLTISPLVEHYSIRVSLAQTP